MPLASALPLLARPQLRKAYLSLTWPQQAELRNEGLPWREQVGEMRAHLMQQLAAAGLQVQRGEQALEEGSCSTAFGGRWPWSSTRLWLPGAELCCLLARG